MKATDAPDVSKIGHARQEGGGQLRKQAAPSPDNLDSFVRCRQCGKPVEKVRECYATPVCYACLPPPPPLPRIHTPNALGSPSSERSDTK
jgi:hypothetical protein